MTERSVLTVSQLAKKHPAFREGGIRHWIFHGEKNGFKNVLRRIGRKILIDEQLFFDWLDKQNNK